MPINPFDGDDLEPGSQPNDEWDEPPAPPRRMAPSKDGRTFSVGPPKSSGPIRGLNLEAEHFTAEGVLDFAKLVVEAREVGSSRGDVLSHSSDDSFSSAGPSVGAPPTSARPRNAPQSSRSFPLFGVIAAIIVAAVTLALVIQGYSVHPNPGPNYPLISTAGVGLTWLITFASLVLTLIFARRATTRLRTKHRVTKLVEESLDVAKFELNVELQKASGGGSQ